MQEIDFSKYKIKETEEKIKITHWQEVAIKTCEEFNIKGFYKQIIFKHAKSNLNYLLGKVTYAKDRFGEYNVEDKGRYLISLFKKKKPWED